MYLKSLGVAERVKLWEVFFFFFGSGSGGWVYLKSLGWGRGAGQTLGGVFFFFLGADPVGGCT